MEMNQYLTMFIDESREHLQTMNENLLELENNPDDIDIVHNIFRSAHTLKGMSATMGFEDLASLTHEMENVLDLVRNGKLKMDTDITDVLFQCFDSLEAMVEDIANGGSGQLDVSETVQTLKAIMSGDFKGSSREAQTSPSSAISSKPYFIAYVGSIPADCTQAVAGIGASCVLDSGRDRCKLCT